MDIKRHPSRSELIQAMRFVAATLVLITHSTFYYNERVNGSVDVWHWGEMGVPVFFVISGIVMVLSSQTLPRNAQGGLLFLKLRLIRIVPLYWLVTGIKVAIAIAVPAVINHNHFDPVYALKSFLFIPAYNQAGEVRPIHGVGWTLLHEMFFYVLFSAALFARKSPVIVASSMIVALFGLGLAIDPTIAVLSVVTSPVNLYFVVGMLIGTAVLQRWSRALTTTCLAALALTSLAGWLPLDSVVLALSAAMLLLIYARVPIALRLSLPLGDSSYALYLFHPLIAPAVLVVLAKIIKGLPPAVAISTAVVVTIAAAHAIHLIVERPITRRLRHALGRRPPQGQPQEAI